jgi:hypothetical protein
MNGERAFEKARALMREPGALAVDGAVERVELERVVRADRQPGDAVTDPVVGRLQRRLAQVLLVGRLQYVIGNRWCAT